MNITMFLILLFFGIGVIWFSLDIWIAPDRFIRKIHKIRSSFYNSDLGFLSQFGYSEYLDKNPEIEIWLARLGFVFSYGVIIFGIYKSIFR
jgi:hypothetical protein